MTQGNDTSAPAPISLLRLETALNDSFSQGTPCIDGRIARCQIPGC